jgi:predicted nucleic acid-binding protein
MSYWDTSCLVKLYTPEADSHTFQQHALQAGSVLSASIARFEMWATLRRKESEGFLAKGEARQALDKFDQDVIASSMRLLELDDVVELEFEAIVDRCHGHSPPVCLRTLDALHLATARDAGETEIVTTDKRMRDAALLLGFSVFPPPATTGPAVQAP